MSVEGTAAERVVAGLDGRGLDLLLVTAPENVRAVTGFTGSSGLAVIGARERVFLTDFRYVTQAAEQLDPSWARPDPVLDLLEGAAGVLAGRAAVRVGFDDALMSVADHGRLAGLLDDEVELVAAGGVVEEVRAVKAPDEVARIRAAAELADAAFERVVGRGLVGRTERDVALDLEVEMRRAGAEEVAFPPIVAAGAHGALPHAEPRAVDIPPDTLVVIDWGARLDGWCSDCTRTVATGVLEPDALEVYELVRAAQEAGLRAVEPGPLGREVDAVAREVITTGGHGERFGHGLGHGVGLEVHEGPRLSKRGEDPLVPGHVVTVEPGVYVPGRFGVRIEDLVAVGESGHEVLSGLDKDLRTVA